MLISLAISIHALRGEGDVEPEIDWSEPLISIHALRGEGDPCWWQIVFSMIYFYPRPPWGGRRRHDRRSKKIATISIHALRGEGDSVPFLAAVSIWRFLSTPSVGRATRVCYNKGKKSLQFLSTPSVGRATGGRPAQRV